MYETCFNENSKQKQQKPKHDSLLLINFIKQSWSKIYKINIFKLKAGSDLGSQAFGMVFFLTLIKEEQKKIFKKTVNLLPMGQY